MFRLIIRPVLLLFSKNKELVNKLYPILGFIPSRVALYEIAFIHKSSSVTLPDGEVVNNERLEFLGDAILDAVIADYLFRRFPENDEGFLTKMRSKMVKRKHLNLLAYHIGFKQLVISQSSVAKDSKHLYGNAFEAMIGAIYLDRGYQCTYKFIERIIDKYVNIEKLKQIDSDYKSRLIEWAQKEKQEIIFESKVGVNSQIKHPHFVCHILLSNAEIGRGTGNSKKEAEQKASKMSLEKLLA
ncbi:MAG: ribonuclease III [Bacteroidales bacterium]|nr:ribonuclease III [Bacteroidales bacterium]MCF8390115.1 ribonuclease III [Bacteroidales bacterium]